MNDFALPRYSALVITVGGSPEPVRHAVQRIRPDVILFVVSAATRPDAEKIVRGLEWTPQYECLEVPDPQDLDQCFQTLHREIPAWLQRRNLPAEAVTVDITGGTKPMAASLALAGCEWFHRFCYTAGERIGAGTVISGTERPVETCNPWDTFALRECALAQRLLDGLHAEPAAQILRAAAERTPACARSLQALARLTELLGQADRFDFRSLARELGSIESTLHPLEVNVEALQRHWAALERERPDGVRQHQATALELIANAGRRAHQGRFEDAVARLYRATELLYQDAVARAFPGRLGKIPQAALSAELQDQFRDPLSRWLNEGTYRLPLEGCVQALALSGDAGFIALANRYPEMQPWLERRNTSIMAHGLRPAGVDDYQGLRSAVLESFTIEDASIPGWPALDLARSARVLRASASA